MMEHHRTTFRLFAIDVEGRDIKDLDGMLQSKVRNHDLIGMGENQKLYVLAAQVDESSEQIVLQRFLSMGLKCRIVETIGE